MALKYINLKFHYDTNTECATTPGCVSADAAVSNGSVFGAPGCAPAGGCGEAVKYIH